LSTDVEKQLLSCDLNPVCFFIATWRINKLSGLAVLLVFGSYLLQNKTEEDLLPKCAVFQLFPFPQLICEAGFSSYAQQNLNIVTELMSQSTWEFSSLQSLSSCRTLWDEWITLFFTLVSYEVRGTQIVRVCHSVRL
jgi:hypothetical protein